MRHWILAVLLSGASGLAAAGDEMPCEKPEYALLKDASRQELDREFCTAKMRYRLNQGALESTHQLIRDKIGLGVNTDKDKEQANAYAREVRACAVAASDYENALSRRFKARPPGPCVKGE